MDREQLKAQRKELNKQIDKLENAAMKATEAEKDEIYKEIGRLSRKQAEVIFAICEYDTDVMEFII